MEQPMTQPHWMNNARNVLLLQLAFSHVFRKKKRKVRKWLLFCIYEDTSVTTMDAVPAATAMATAAAVDDVVCETNISSHDHKTMIPIVGVVHDDKANSDDDNSSSDEDSSSSDNDDNNDNSKSSSNVDCKTNDINSNAFDYYNSGYLLVQEHDHGNILDILDLLDHAQLHYRPQ
jgi:hypothetical protein